MRSLLFLSCLVAILATDSRAFGQKKGLSKNAAAREAAPRLMQEQEFPSKLVCVAFVADDKGILSCESDGVVRILDAANLEQVSLRRSDVAIKRATLRNDGKALLLAGENERSFYWDLTAQDVPKAIGIKGSDAQFRPGSPEIMFVNERSEIRALNLETGAQRVAVRCPEMGTLAIDSTETRAATPVGREERTVFVWDLDTGTPTKVLDGHKGSLFCVAFSPDGKFLVASTWSGDEDRHLHIWNLEQAGERRQLAAPPYARSLIVSQNSSTIAVMCQAISKHTIGKVVVVWHLATGKELARLQFSPESPSPGIALSGDGKKLACWTDKVLRVFDLRKQ